MPSENELKIIDEKQRQMLVNFSKTQESGKMVEYLGKEFVVLKDVFWPFEDSKPLVENYYIKKGETVLDVCTGSGIIAIFSAYRGAAKVSATDISSQAVKCARINAEKHGFSKVINVFQGDLFEPVKEEMFDVITANLPFRNKTTTNLLEQTMWDNKLTTLKKFFSQVDKFLKQNGRIYMSQANFGAVEELKTFAQETGFNTALIGTRKMPGEDPREFYALELKRK